MNEDDYNLYKCLKMKKTRWWFQIFFICKLGEMIQFDEHIFQIGLVQFLRFLALFLQHFFAEKPHNLRFCQQKTPSDLRTSSHEGPRFETPFCRLEPFIQLGGGREQNKRDFPTSSALTFSRNPGKYFTQYIQSHLKNGISCPQNILVNLVTPKTSGGIRISSGTGLAKTPEHSWIAWRITRRKCARIQEYVEAQIHINTYVNV